MFYALDSLEVELVDTNMAKLSSLVNLPAGCIRVQIQNRGANDSYVGVKYGDSAPAKDDCFKLAENKVVTIEGAPANVWVGADGTQSLVCIPYIGSAGN